MKVDNLKAIYFCTILISVCALISCSPTIRIRKSADATVSNVKTVNNPILKGFNPDPSICRVGDDYYMVTSTFEYFPGVPIYHSKDLINWKLIGHAIHRTNQLDFSEIPATHGVFAPTIRYNKGTFYMITTFVTQLQGQQSSKEVKGGNFIVTAKNPAGPWSDPHWIADAPGIDPDLFFDDDGNAGKRRPESKSG